MPEASASDLRASGAGPARQHTGITLATLAIASLCYALSQTMLAPAIPKIQADLGVSTTYASWMLTAFLLSASIATPVIGRLGDMFGKDKMLFWSLGVFGAGSVIGVLGDSMPILIAARALQGASAGVFPLAYGIIRDELPEDKVAGGIGLISGTFGIGGGVGLVISGLIVDHVDYKWIFAISVGVAAIALAATRRWIPASRLKTPGRIDWVGAAILGLGLAGLLVAITETDVWGWTAAKTLGLAAVSLLVLAGWAAFEARTPEPLVDMRWMRERTVAMTNLASGLIGWGMFASFILLPQLVQSPASSGVGFDATVTQAGLFMLPMTTVMLISGPVGGALATRRGAKFPMTMGAASLSLGFAWLALLHATHLEVVIGSAILGWGVGLAFASMANLIVEVVPQEQTGEATGVNNVARTVGGALGAQIAASILAEHLAAGGASTSNAGFTLAFIVTGVVGAVGIAVSLLIPGVGSRGATPLREPALATAASAPGPAPGD